MKSDLSLLDLNKYEYNVYVFLVKTGKSTALKISKNSGVPYGRIYDILGSLENKGLVHVIPDKTKNYIASNPKNIINLLEKNRKRLDQLKNEFNELKQFYNVRKEEVVKLAEGHKNFYRLVADLPLPKKLKYNIRYLTSGDYKWINENELQIKKGIIIKTLIDEKKALKENVKKWLKVLPEMRHLDNEGVAISIIDDEAIMIGLVHSNITLLIKDKAFVRLMKKLFVYTYAKCSRVKI